MEDADSCKLICLTCLDIYIILGLPFLCSLLIEKEGIYWFAPVGMLVNSGEDPNVVCSISWASKEWIWGQRSGVKLFRT